MIVNEHFSGSGTDLFDGTVGNFQVTFQNPGSLAAVMSATDPVLPTGSNAAGGGGYPQLTLSSLPQSVVTGVNQWLTAAALKVNQQGPLATAAAATQTTLQNDANAVDAAVAAYQAAYQALQTLGGYLPNVIKEVTEIFSSQKPSTSAINAYNSAQTALTNAVGQLQVDLQVAPMSLGAAGKTDAGASNAPGSRSSDPAPATNAKGILMLKPGLVRPAGPSTAQLAVAQHPITGALSIVQAPTANRDLSTPVVPSSDQNWLLWGGIGLAGAAALYFMTRGKAA